jgi:hypothetical protein
MHDEKFIQTLVGKCEERRQLGIFRCIWENNIKMDLKHTGCEDVGWIHLNQDREKWQALVNMVMSLQIPYEVGDLTR